MRDIQGFFADFLPKSYVHCTQLLQAEAMAHAFSAWRRQWGHGRKCGGALVWQLNDCWPCTSWAVVDYFIRKKPAYYEIARALKTVTVNVRRAHREWSDISSTMRQAVAQPNVPFEVWICSSQVQEASTLADVEIRFVSTSSGRDIRKRLVKSGIRINPNGTTEVLRGETDMMNNEPHVIAVKLWINGECPSRDVDWPQPLKHVFFHADRGVRVKADFEGTAGTLTVCSMKPVKGFVFEERDGVTLSDSGFSIVPGDEQIIQVEGLSAEDRPLGWQFLGQEESECSRP
jgi:beta-mannosidase